MTSETVSFDVPTLGTTSAHFAQPPGEAPVPGLIVVHEWWGLNDDIRGVCDRFAGAGFATLGVDLYGGRSTTDPAEAAKLADEMKSEEALQIVEAGVRFLTLQKRLRRSKVGVTGFCLGGAISLAAACHVPGLSAAVPFYGIPRRDLVNFATPCPPIQAHFGSRDASIPVGRIQLVADMAQLAGHRFELCLYDAGHAFMREKDPKAYDAPAAELAWTRAVSFLLAELR
jgi:carboxymethylenebutenolidase